MEPIFLVFIFLWCMYCICNIVHGESKPIFTFALSIPISIYECVRFFSLNTDTGTKSCDCRWTLVQISNEKSVIYKTINDLFGWGLKSISFQRIHSIVFIFWSNYAELFAVKNALQFLENNVSIDQIYEIVNIPNISKILWIRNSIRLALIIHAIWRFIRSPSILAAWKFY